MNELVFKSEKGTPVTNSLLVAEKFGKQHKDVLESIRNLVAENSAAKSYFFETEYESRGKMYPMYIMNRDGFSLLVMGFTGKEALSFKMEFLGAFNKMESMLQSDEYILMRSQEILNNRVKQLESKVYQQLEVIEHKNVEIQQLLPDAQYARDTLKSTDTFTTTQIAKELGMSAEKLNNRLHELGVQYKVNKQWVLYAKYEDRGYTKTNTYTEIINGESRTFHSTVWTEAGRKFIHELIKNEKAA